MGPRSMVTRAAVFAATALVGSLIVVIPATADTTASYRARAFGIRENAAKVATNELEVAVPPAETQHDSLSLVDAQPVAEAAHIEVDACLNGGVPASLQAEMDRAEFLARGGDPDEPTPDPALSPARVPANFPEESCLTPAGPEDPPTDVLCEDFDPEAPVETCLTTELWNARASGFVLDALAGIIHEIDSEAVVRCHGVDEPAEFMTGAAYDITGVVNADTEQPNQPLDIILLQSATVLFWETNWDPRTNTTTDGSDTVWVNGLHIITPAEDIILARSEATANCPVSEPTPTPPQPGPTIPTPPPGGFPRDVSLGASKNILHFGKTLTLSGAVTPATEFETPRTCVEGVTVTIRRDVVGPPEEFVDVGTTVTDVEGNFSFDFEADRNAQWLAFIAKDNPTDCAQVASQTRSVLVRPRLKLVPINRRPRRGGTVRFRTELIPCDGHAGTRVKLRREFDGRSVKVKFTRLDGNCVGRFAVKANFKRAVFDAAWPKQDADHQSTTARPKVITTRRRR